MNTCDLNLSDDARELLLVCFRSQVVSDNDSHPAVTLRSTVPDRHYTGVRAQDIRNALQELLNCQLIVFTDNRQLTLTTRGYEVLARLVG